MKTSRGQVRTNRRMPFVLTFPQHDRLAGPLVVFISSAFFICFSSCVEPTDSMLMNRENSPSSASRIGDAAKSRWSLRVFAKQQTTHLVVGP